MSKPSSWRGLTLALALALPACKSGVAAPILPESATITVDASTSTAYLALVDGAVVPVTVADPATSTAWDVSLFSTTVAANASAGTSVYCICSNESASADAVMAMTPTGQLAGFDSVAAVHIPETASFAADVFAIHKWYRYNLTGTDNQIWPVFNVYLVQRGAAVYKIQLTNYYNAAGAPRHVTIRYARLRS